jgi:hypothetical protein
MDFIPDGMTPAARKPHSQRLSAAVRKRFTPEAIAAGGLVSG